MRKLEFYEHCTITNRPESNLCVAVYQTEAILDYVYLDTLGPTKTVLLGDSNWFVWLMDECL